MDLLQLDYQTPTIEKDNKLLNKRLKSREHYISVNLKSGLSLGGNLVGSPLSVVEDSIKVTSESGTIELQVDPNITISDELLKIGQTVRFNNLEIARPQTLPWAVRLTSQALLVSPFNQTYASDVSYNKLYDASSGTTSCNVTLLNQVVVSQVEVELSTSVKTNLSVTLSTTTLSTTSVFGSWQGSVVNTERVVVDADWTFIKSFKLTVSGVCSVGGIYVLQPSTEKSEDVVPLNQGLVPCTITTLPTRGVYFQNLLPVISIDDVVVRRYRFEVDISQIVDASTNSTNTWKTVVSQNTNQLFSIPVRNYANTLNVYGGIPSTWTFTTTPTGLGGVAQEDFENGNMFIIGIDAQKNIIRLQSYKPPEPWYGLQVFGAGGSKCKLQRIDRIDNASTVSTNYVYSKLFDSPIYNITSIKAVSSNVPFTIHNRLPTGKIEWDAIGSGTNAQYGSVELPTTVLTYVSSYYLLELFLTTLNTFSTRVNFSYSGQQYTSSNNVYTKSPIGAFNIVCKSSDTLAVSGFASFQATGQFTYNKHGLLLNDPVTLICTCNDGTILDIQYKVVGVGVNTVTLSVLPGFESVNTTFTSKLSVSSAISTINVWRPYRLRMRGEILSKLGISSSKTYSDKIYSSGFINIYPAQFLNIWLTMYPSADPGSNIKWDTVGKIPLVGEEGTYIHDKQVSFEQTFDPPLNVVEGLTFYFAFPEESPVNLGSFPVGMTFLIVESTQ